MSAATAMPDAPPSYNEIAAAMASQGVRLDTEFDQAPPEPDNAAPEPSAKPETGKPTPEPAVASAKPTETAAAAPAPQPQATTTTPEKVDWREEAKKADPSELMALLGFDDKLKGFVNKWKAGEDVTPYVRAASIDYSKMPAEEVMRHQLRQEFPELSEEDFQLVYESRVTNKYQLDPELFDEKQRKVGQVLLNADANKVRQTLSTAQQQLILNTKPPAPSGPTAQQQAEQAQNTRNWFKAEVLKDPLAASVMSTKELTIGEGVEAFHFKIDDPDDLFNTVADQSKMIEAIFDKRQVEGKDMYFPNGQKNTLIGVIAKYGMQVFDLYGKHMRALGAAAALEPIDNASGPASKTTSTFDKEMTPAEALARQGQIVT